MNFETIHVLEGIDLHYSIQKSVSESDVLIVSFPGGGGKIWDEVGYVFTLKKHNCNALFIKADSIVIKSLFCYCNKTTIIEECIFKLISDTLKLFNSSRVVVIGSSLGGYTALYYGIKYNWDIVSGSPMTFISDNEYIKFCTGGVSDIDKSWLNQRLYVEIKNHANKYSKKLFISFGAGEHNYTDPNKGKLLVSQLDILKMKYHLELFPFNNHDSIHRLFPLVLDAVIPQLLNKSDVIDYSTICLFNNDDGIHFLSKVSKQFDDLALLINDFKKIHSSVLASQSINDCQIYHKRTSEAELRDYCYIRQGYVYSKKLKRTIKLSDYGGFWGMFDQYMAFQSGLLDLYLTTKDPNIMNWLLDNLEQWLPFRNYNKKGVKCGVEKILTRFYYILSLFTFSDSFSHSVFNKKQDILNVLSDDLIYLLKLPISNNIHMPYVMIRVIVSYIAIFDKSSEFFNSIFSKCFDILDGLNRFCFNIDGLCVYGLAEHEKISIELHKIANFLKSNGFSGFKSFNNLLGFIRKADLFNSHILQPNNQLVPLGHTKILPSTLEVYVNRKKSNCIKSTSDIAFLDDGLSYFSLGTGNPYKTNHRHYDLLSFTWFYKGLKVFCDPGSSDDANLFNYLSSNYAHNSFFCADKKYCFPNSMDFTTFNYINENSGYLEILMTHDLVDDTFFSRKFVWIKPNIVILIDKASSKNAHNYVQNFILNNYKYQRISPNSISVFLAPELSLNIMQHVINQDFYVEVFGGAVNTATYRGAIMDSTGKGLSPGLNISFCHNSNDCLFVTSLVINGTSKEELSIEKLINNGSSLDLLLSNGQISISM